MLRFVPTSISNEELFKKLSSTYEIVGVRRFTRKVNGELKPYGSVSVTFLTNSLPDYVYLDIFRFKVFEYVAPLLQCFKCFKFNHGAKVCRTTQKCSICAGEHRFSECNNKNAIKCINCEGPHLAVSRDCPIKKKKIEEKSNRSRYATYANALIGSRDNSVLTNYDNAFPSLRATKTSQNLTITKSNKNDKNVAQENPKEITQKTPESTTKESTLKVSSTATAPSTDALVEEIIKNEYVLKGLVGTLVTLGNGGHPITMAYIKDILIKTFKNG